LWLFESKNDQLLKMDENMLKSCRSVWIDKNYIVWLKILNIKKIKLDCWNLGCLENNAFTNKMEHQVTIQENDSKQLVFFSFFMKCQNEDIKC